MDGAQALVVHRRPEIRTSAIVLFWQIIDAAATALSTFAAFALANPHQGFPAVTVKLVTVTVWPVAMLVLLSTKSVVTLPWM